MNATTLNTPQKRTWGRASRSRVRVAFWPLFLLFIWGGVAPVNAQDIARTSGDVFYMDTPKDLFGAYTAYRVSNNSGSDWDDVWVTIGSFGSGTVDLAPGEDGLVSLGSLGDGESAMAYFYLAATGPVATPQLHTVSVYDGHPESGGVLEGSEDFSIVAVEETIAANANKVVTGFSMPNPAVLGDVMTLSIEGETGTIGLSSLLSYTPAAYLNWPADAFQLVSSEIVFSGGNSDTWTDQLVGTLPVKANTDYVATYAFVIKGTTETSIPLSPIGYIASGTQIKHTYTGDFGELPPILPPSVPDFIDLELQVTATDAAPLEGTSTTVSVTVTNAAVDGQTEEVTATDVAVYPFLPPGLPLVSTAGDGSYDTGTGVWTVGDLAVGESATLDLLLSVPLDDLSTFTFVSEVLSVNEQDVDSTPNNSIVDEDDRDSVDITPVAIPEIDLELTSDVDNPSPLEGSTVTFTLTLSNANGDTDATGVSVYAPLPAGLPLLSATGDGSYDDVSGLWTVGSLAVGETATVTLSLLAVVPAPGDPGYGEDTVFEAEVVSANEPDKDSTPNNGILGEDDDTTVEVIPVPVPEIDLELTADVDNPTPLEGSTVTFTLTLSNANGETDATGVSVYAPLPAGLPLLTASGDGSYDDVSGLWTVGTLGVGETATVTLELLAVVPAPGDPGYGEDTVFEAEVVSANEPDMDSTPNNGVIGEDDDATVDVTPLPIPEIDLELTADVTDGSPVEGTQTTITLTLTNNADADLPASGVEVFTGLPAGLPLLPYDWTLDLGDLASHGTFDPDTGVWTVGGLAVGESATLTLVLDVPAEGEEGYGESTEFFAEVVAANEPDSDSEPNNGLTDEDDYASVSVTPVPPDRIDLAVDVAVDDDNAKAGTVATYTVTVTNEGGADIDATGVEVYTVIPSGLLAIPYDYGTDVGDLVSHGSYDPNSGIWEVGTLTVGQTATLEIAVLVPDEWDAGYGESTLVEAEVLAADAPDYDSTPGNGANDEDDYDAQGITPAPGDRIDLELTVDADNLTPTRGTTVTYTVTVTNAAIDGRDALTATGVEVYALIPPGTPVYPDVYLSEPNGLASQGSFDFGTQTWSVGTLAVGESATLTLILYVPVPSESELGFGESELFWAEVSAAGEPDVDSTPGNYPTDEDDNDEVNLEPSSGGGSGGIESNATMASQLAQVLFDRRRAGEVRLADDAALAPFVAGGVAGKGAAASSADLLRVVIPQTGPAQSTAYETSPRDLLPVTNADDVVAADFLRDADGRRVGAFFGALTTGELYEHTKVICDRLRGGVLGLVGRETIAGRPFLVSRIDHEDGSVDYAISMNVLRVGGSFQVDSRFRLDEYNTPDGSDDILNLQVWAQNRQFAVELAEDVLGRLEQLGPVSFANDQANPPVVPEVYVRTGRYEDGKLMLELFNGKGVDHIRLTGGSIALTERGERYTFERDIVLPPANERGIVQVELPLGPVFDATFFVETPDGERDQMYMADGAWSYSFDGSGARVQNFDVDPATETAPENGFYAVERAATLEGQVKTWAVMYRYLRPNGKPVDLSEYGYAEFTASGEGQVRVLFEKASVTTSDHYGTVIKLTGEPKTYRLWFDELRRPDGTGRLTAEDLSLVSFYVYGDQSRERPFELKVSDLRFGGGEGDPLAVVPDAYELEQNYPNPFNPQTQIAFGMPNAGQVRLSVYDVLGREVATLLDGFMPEGRHSVTFDASHLTSGTYLYRLETGERTVTKTMTLLR